MPITSALEPARRRQRRASPPLHELPMFTTARPVTIIAGPPCSGRHALAVQFAARSRGVVVSGDAIAAALHRAPYLALLSLAKRDAVIHARNLRLTSFCSTDPTNALHAHAYVVTAASTPEAREGWRERGASVLVLHPGVDACLARLAALDLAEDQIELLSRAVRAWR
jgi:hypothetical protein